MKKLYTCHIQVAIVQSTVYVYMYKFVSYTLNTSTPTCATICLLSSTSYTNSRIYHSLGILHSYICKYSEQLSQPQKNSWQYVEIRNRSCKFTEIEWLPCISFMDYLVVAPFALNLYLCCCYLWTRHIWITKGEPCIETKSYIFLERGDKNTAQVTSSSNFLIFSSWGGRWSTE